MSKRDGPMSARLRYHSDPLFAAMVNNMVALIDQCELTPSELRQAAILACIISEEGQTRMMIRDKRGLRIIRDLEAWLNGEEKHNDRICPHDPS